MTDRRTFLAKLGIGLAAGAGLLGTPGRLLAATPPDVAATAPDRYRPLLHTVERYIGRPESRLPRAKVLDRPASDNALGALARAIRQWVPEAEAAGSHWSATIAAARALDPFQRLAIVNRFVNQTPWVEDSVNYGVGDYWADVDAFLENGGDCEDFAVAKYKLLTALGYHPQRLRVVMLVDNRRNRQHAVTAAWLDDRVLLLDALMANVVEQDEVHHYLPTLSLDRHRLYLHTREAPQT
ncbi:MAG: transglutaminase-like cysteine peptidase [Alphaproteobacteria bacterium]